MYIVSHSFAIDKTALRKVSAVSDSRVLSICRRRSMAVPDVTPLGVAPTTIICETAAVYSIEFSSRSISFRTVPGSSGFDRNCGGPP